MSKINIMSLLLVGMFVVSLCCSQQVFAEGKPDGAGGKPNDNGNESGAGNCLSMPVIWSDGVTKALREPTDGIPTFDGDHTEIGGVVWYHQQDPDNVWQAETADWSEEAVNVNTIDWGDNLEAVDWNENSKVRVEVTLWQDVAAMNAFEMAWVFGELGADEMWGAKKVAYSSDLATVYSGCARLTIQKLTRSHLDPDDPIILTWDSVNDEWVGADANPAIVNKGVWEGVDGPGDYNAEINISGKCMYGYNWDVKDTEQGAGSYRLTFSLDPINGPVLNTFFTAGITEIMLPEVEPEESTMESDDGGDTGEPEMGGVAVLDCANNLTYIDLNILAK